MAEALWLVTKTVEPGDTLIDGVTAVVINNDDADSAAQTIIDATAKAVAQGHPLPTGYFDAAAVISDLAGASALRTDGDNYVFGTIKSSQTT
jgi:hypothetical protein